MRFTIRNKLLVAFLSVSFFVTAANITAYLYNDELNHSYDRILDQHVVVLSKAKEIQYLTLQQSNSLKGYLLSRDPEFLNSLQTSNASIRELVTQVEGMVSAPASAASFQKLIRADESFFTSVEKLRANLGLDKNKEASLDYFKTDVLPFGNTLPPLSKAFVDEQQRILNQARASTHALVNFVNALTAILSILIFLLTLLIGLLLSHRITSNLSKITRVLTGFAHDSDAASRLPRIEVSAKDEIGDIAHSFNEMAKTLEHYSNLEQDQRWLESNIAELATQFQGVHKLEVLAQQVITTITPLVGASYGVFYIKQGEGRHQQLTKLAAYAYQMHGIGSIKLGEGLVGQAALEGRQILIDNVPDNYIPIASGLGKAQPSSLLIMPLKFENQVVAVIELASLGEFSAIQQTLLQQAANHLGSILNSIAGRMQVEQLLVESQTLSEELQAQSEELQLQQEELRGINEKLEEQHQTSEHKTRELEKTKAQLEEKARQLTLSSQYKSEFLANMSHELRTPLNSLLILSNILSENSSGNLNDNQVKYAHTIHQSGNDLLHLINDILDLSKVESGKIDLFPSMVNLNEICESSEQQFLPMARQKNLAFATILDPDLPQAIYTDEQRLMQIVKNLLSNAFKFTERGEVKLHIHRARSNGIAFSIHDTGIGIPKEKQSLIFQAFQQADGTTNRKYGGTGLGLSISLNIAQLLNGEIMVDSTVGRGSVFSLVLPCEEWDAAPSPVRFHQEAAVALVSTTTDTANSSMEPDDTVWTGKKVLIVDDDMRNVFATSIALESKKMTVLFAENGYKCLKVLEQHPDVDLILMDIMLPEMDGYETMRALRQMARYESLPIIALTAKAMKDDKEKCIQAGASDYISKPVKLEQLFARIRFWLK